MHKDRAIVRWLMLAVVILSFSVASFSQIGVGISVRVGPPPLPIYAQPICPGPGYMWTPGYWGWNEDAGYYWVPGTWVIAPVGMLWTPGYWGWGGGFYAWHPGYWGPHIGFYGGINYGFGYTGVGFVGGEWRGGAFYYNRSVTNVSVTNVTRVYNRTVVVNNTRTTSFNGGTGGVEARPTVQEEAVAHERHTAALETQTQHERLASQNRENFASANHGRPTVAATARAGDFSGRSAVPARAAGGEYHAPTMSPKEARGPSPAGSKGNSNEGFRPFTKPESGNSQNKGAGGGATSQEHGKTGTNSSHQSNDRPATPHGSNPPKGNTSRPAPQHNSNPAPHKQSAPKEQHHKGR
jgi:YXWGXW repeat-containing protein